MTGKKTVKIFTIVSHALIILGVGHGIGFMGLIDVASIPNLISDYGFTLKGSFSDRIMSIGLISLVGKVLLLISFFIKKFQTKEILEFLGLILLWVSFFFLNFNLGSNSSGGIIFFTGIPFLISSVIFAFVMVFGNFTKK
ncbi:hypothetical protein [uncultured Tenacibaculum sp.]|uniref:hypothetical protein n=1 Tax=uncultured Tenacibaculum sp. TaxID=174713 RepID=UPI0026038B13|nr:hypothetical protein [uncultured Tenacibaculum sp.]